MQHAWHFYYALLSVVKVLCGNRSNASLTP
nr:DUF3265 domain-containing protein [Vibrio sp. 10N.261.54.E10]